MIRQGKRAIVNVSSGAGRSASITGACLDVNGGRQMY